MKRKNKNSVIRKKRAKLNPVVKLERLESELSKDRTIESNSDSSSETDNGGNFLKCLYSGIWNKSPQNCKIFDESSTSIQMPNYTGYGNNSIPHRTFKKIRKSVYNKLTEDIKEIDVLNKFRQIEENLPLEQYPCKKSTLYEKTAKDLDISLDAVRQILEKPKSNKSLPILNDFTENAIRKIIHRLYMNGELPTKETVLQIINDDIKLPFLNMATFNCLLDYLKMATVKKRNNYPLIDREDVMLERVNYLKKIKEYRKHGCVYYLDELVLLADNTVEEKKKSANMIIVFVGNECGFVKDCLGIFYTDAKPEHRNAAHHFEGWFEQTINKLEKGSIIVMDDAPCHSRVQNAIPTEQWTKKDIQVWMSNNGINYEPDSLKFDLLSKIKEFQTKQTLFFIDEIAKKHKIEILRIPSFHYDLNPMTYIWSDINEFIKKFKETNMKVVRDAQDNLPVEKWRKAIQTVVDLEESFYSKIDDVMDDAIDRYLERVFSDSHSEESDEEEIDNTE